VRLELGDGGGAIDAGARASFERGRLVELDQHELVAVVVLVIVVVV